MRPLAVQIAMLADESSTLDCVSLSQRILRQQLELLPCPDLVVWFVCVSRKAHVTPLSEGRNERRNYLKLPFRLELCEEQLSHWESGAFDNGNGTAPGKWLYHGVSIKSGKDLLTSQGTV